MESESLVMVRCPECGGLMVEGRDCRQCAEGVRQDPLGDGPVIAPPLPAADKRGFPLIAVVIAVLVVLLVLVGAAAVMLGGSSDPVIEGWHKVEGRNVSLLLPEEWAGGEPGSEVLDQVLMAMRSFGPSYDVLARAIEANPDAILLFAVDQSPAVDGFATNVNAVAEKAPGNVSLDEYVEAAAGLLPASFQVQESGIKKVGPHEAARMVIRFDLPTGGGQQVAYIIKDGSVFWSITYTTSTAEFGTRLYDFERSAATIRLD